MTIVNILRDGTVEPPLRHDRLIVRILNGHIQIGRYDALRYSNGNQEYIAEPYNALELKNELIRQINAEMPDLFSKHYTIHVQCPQNIAAMVRWWPSEQPYKSMATGDAA